MLALSVRQPWAWAMFYLARPKDVENRSWATRVRGRILIHAAKGMTPVEYMDAQRAFPDVTWPAIHLPQRGGIIGSVTITDCVTPSWTPSRWAFGPYCFLLADPKPSPFTPYRGLQRFFEVPGAWA